MQVNGMTSISPMLSWQQMRESMFSKIDTDGDGSVSLSELEAGAAESAGNPAQTADTSKIEALFKSADTDEDGKLTESELDAQFRNLAPDTMGQMVQMQGQSPPSPDQAFAAADTDGSGSLSLDEFKAMGKAHAHHHHHAQNAASSGTDDDKASGLFSKIDSDGNGALSQEELDAFFSQNGPPDRDAAPQNAGSTGQDSSASTSALADAVAKQIQSYLSQLLSKDGSGNTTKTGVVA